MEEEEEGEEDLEEELEEHLVGHAAAHGCAHLGGLAGQPVQRPDVQDLEWVIIPFVKVA